MADQTEKTIFKKIIDGELPAERIYEDEHCLAFPDIDPKAPTHILVIPKKEIRSIADLNPDDQQLMGHIMLAIGNIARQIGLDENGYRIVTNVGSDGGQAVDHLHFHLLGGRQMKWPPG